MKPKDFLTADQQKTVVDAVRIAEKGTPGEIRIHIEGGCGTHPGKRAEEGFGGHGMHKTRLRNGVLIYVACNTRVFAIIGDKGINEAVPENFWEDVIRIMSARFREGQFAEGLAEAVEAAGEKLKAFFPISSDDINEQPDEISFGK